MGNRSYLLVKQAEKYNALFEGNNTFAIFWLLLMDNNDIEYLCDELDKFYDDNQTADTLIKLERDKAIKLALSRRPYLEKFHPLALGLFEQWLDFLVLEKTDDNRLYVDLTEISCFYTSTQEFKAVFLDMLDSIEQQSKVVADNDIADLCGYESWDNQDRFRKISSEYQRLEKTPILPIEINSTLPSRQKRLFITHKILALMVIVILIAVVCLLIFLNTV